METKSALDEDVSLDIDARLDRGVAVLHASARLGHEDAATDRELVLAIVDAVMGVR